MQSAASEFKLELMSTRPDRVKSLAEMCVQFIATKTFLFSPDTWERIKAANLSEPLQRHMCRMNQVKHLQNYKSWFQDGKPEMWEQYDKAGRKNGPCLYW